MICLRDLYGCGDISKPHNVSFERALESVRAIAYTEADAVKIQPYTADTLTIDCDSEYIRIKGDTLWEG